MQFDDVHVLHLGEELHILDHFIQYFRRFLVLTWVSFSQIVSADNLHSIYL